MQAKINIGVNASFKLIGRDNDLNVTKESGESTNLVLDAGLDRMSVGGWLGKIVVGSGNSTPSPSQIQLDSPIAVTTNLVSTGTSRHISSTPYYQQVVLTYRFSSGAAAGNISEIGAGWGASMVGSLFDRALVLDSGGNPTTITILSNEILDVVFTLRIYYLQTHTAGEFNLVDQLGGIISTHEYESYIDLVNAFPNGTGGAAPQTISFVYNTAVLMKGVAGSGFQAQWYDHFWSSVLNLGTETTNPSGVVSIATSNNGSVSNSYPTNRSYIGQRLFGITLANGDHEGAIIWTSLGRVKFKYSPKISKNNTESLRVRILVTWDRYAP